VEGSKVVTVNPGAGGALFTKLGPTNPHQYFPNQLFAQSWAYEGLVSYGQDGEISPALATSWTTKNQPDGSGGAIYTFQLREGVKFHDGTDFNCAAAKLNFDHVLHDTVVERHSWFGTPQRLTMWYCNEDDHFVLETDKPYYPQLSGTDLHPPPGHCVALCLCQRDRDQSRLVQLVQFQRFWLQVGHARGYRKYSSTETNEDGSIDTKVIFDGHSGYWGGAPNIEELHIMHYPDNASVEAALLDGSKPSIWRWALVL
jgi:ABC-type transport system substrate-binding protein